MELLKIFILKKIHERFGKEEISQPEMKNFLCSSLRIEKQIVLDVISKLEIDGCIIKNKESKKYRLMKDIEDFIERKIRENHLIITDQKYNNKDNS